MHSISFPTFVNHKQHSKALRVRAVGNPSGWYFILTDGERNVIARNIGQLPSYYPGLEWTDETATLYALAQAKRHIETHFPLHHVALVCAAPNLQKEQRREQHTWAA